MKRKVRLSIISGIVLVIAALGVAVALGGVSLSSSSKVSIPAFGDAELNALPAANWIGPGGNLFGTRHSSLTQITAANVTGLQQAWHVKLAAPNVGDPIPLLGGESSSIVYNGVMYTQDQYGRVYANDAASGNQLWFYEPLEPGISTVSTPTSAGGIAVVAATRGVSIGDGKVFAEEPQGNVVALDATTGKSVWVQKVGSIDKGIGMAEAPVYYDGMILGATSGGDSGYPCVAFALDASTGKPLWHFNVIPATKRNPGYNTWTHPLPFDGGGATWASVSVDSTDGLVYVPTGNPIPYNGLTRGPGMELYTDSVVALHAKTGKLAWAFQEVHHDNWDADQSQQPLLLDLKYKGGPVQHALVSADKDGFVYVLDRATGKPIVPVTEMKVQQSKEASTWPTQPIPATDPLVPQSVADPSAWKGLVAPDGKPFNLGPGGPAGAFTAIDSTAYSITSAFGHGASSNKPASVDPNTSVLVEETTPGFSAFEALPASEISMKYHDYNTFNALKSGSLAGTPAAAVSGARLEAMNLTTGKLMWTVDHLSSQQAPAGPNGASAPSNAFSGGLITTGSGLIFTSSNQQLQAYSESTGQLLWSSPTLPAVPKSNPMSYSVNGKQYVAIYLGGTGDLYAFDLP